MKIRKTLIILALITIIVSTGCVTDNKNTSEIEGVIELEPSGLLADAKILFIGDSITDGGRSYEVNNDLGNHSKLFGDYMKSHFPNENYEIYNTGVAGDTVLDLYYRLKEDCYDINPDYIILQIGVNDAWNGYKGKEIFEMQFRAVIEGIIKNTDAELIVMTPFLLEASSEMQDNCVIANINSYLDIVKEMDEIEISILKELGVTYFSLSEITNMAIEDGIQKAALSNDAIHPTGILQSMMMDNFMVALKITDYNPKFSKYIAIY